MNKVRSAAKKRLRPAGAVKRKKAHEAKPTTPLAVLRAARKLLTPRKAWAQGVFARDADGEMVNLSEATGLEDGAVCWCPDGALTQVCRSYRSKLYDQARALLRRAVPKRSKNDLVWTYNDDALRTHQEVLAWFDRAINLAKAGS